MKTSDLAKAGKHDKKWDFSQISEYIYLGADMCCDGDHYGFLCKTLEIKADLAIIREQLETPSDQLEAFLWLPVADHTAPNKMQLQAAVGFISVCVENKQKVFVHCKLGHGRSPTLVAAYFMSKGMSMEEAIAKIKEARAEIHIEPPQLELLKSL